MGFFVRNDQHLGHARVGREGAIRCAGGGNADDDHIPVVLVEKTPGGSPGLPLEE